MICYIYTYIYISQKYPNKHQHSRYHIYPYTQKDHISLASLLARRGGSIWASRPEPPGDLGGGHPQ